IDRGVGLYQGATDKLWAVGAYASLAASTARDDPAWARFEADIRTRASQISAETLFFTLELNELSDAEIAAALAAQPAARAPGAPARAVARARAAAARQGAGRRELGEALRRDAGQARRARRPRDADAGRGPEPHVGRRSGPPPLGRPGARPRAAGQELDAGAVAQHAGVREAGRGPLAALSDA